MDYAKVGKIISKKRRQKKITKKQLAEILNVEKDCITYWEKGKCLPFLDVMQKLTKTLDISMNDLMGKDADLVSNKSLRRCYLIILLGVVTVLLYNTFVSSVFVVSFFIFGFVLLFKEIKKLYN